MRRDDHGRLEPNPDRIGVVRRVFREYTDDLASTKAIAAGLNRDGLPPPGTTPWTSQNVAHILRNRNYVGEIKHHEDWLPGAHDAIVDVDVFERAQALADQRASSNAVISQRRGDFLLTGVLTCGRCGGTYVGTSGTGRNGQKFRYYSCRRAKARGKEACDAPNIPAGDLEQLAADALVNVYSDTDLFERAIEAYLAQCAERSAPAAEELAATETALQGKQRVRRRYQADYERGDLDARTYSARARELDTEIDTLRDRAEALRAQATPPTVPSTPNAGRLASMRAALTQGITEGAIEERKELVTILVERITINDLDDIQPESP